MNNQSLLTDEEIQEAAQSAAIPEVSGIFLHDLLDEARTIAQMQDAKTRQATRKEVVEWLEGICPHTADQQITLCRLDCYYCRGELHNGKMPGEVKE